MMGFALIFKVLSGVRFLNRGLLPLAALVAAVVLCSSVAWADSGSISTTRYYTPTEAIDEMSCWLLYFQEGTYGGLLLVVSGVGALVSCALGGYRMALNLLIVALGSGLIRPMSELMFDYQLRCDRVIAPPAPSGGNSNGNTTGSV